MSQANYEIIQGVMQAAADSYDGAYDEKGQERKRAPRFRLSPNRRFQVPN